MAKYAQHTVQRVKTKCEDDNGHVSDEGCQACAIESRPSTYMAAKQNNESTKVTVKPLRKQREFPHCLLRDALLIEDRATVLLRTPIVGFSDNVLGQHCRSAIDSIPTDCSSRNMKIPAARWL